MVPRQPRKSLSIRAEPRIRVKILPLQQYDTRPSLLQVYGNNGVLGVVNRAQMVLPDTDPSVSSGINPPVGVAQRSLRVRWSRRNRRGRGSWRDPVQSLVAEIAHIGDAAHNQCS